ncbi:hypothetical protein BD779DRAFT_1673827 [Infundibulicybe gibba]|nr:hypothetical protein BD779DRAFT_1673827 [Infundibulicybe gibba]
MSQSQRKLRMDAAGDGFVEASFFDFTNTTSDGRVANSMLSYEGGVVTPICSSFFIEPGLPLISPGFLNATNAVCTGIQNDDLYGPFTNVQVTVFLDANNRFVRYDFAQPGDPRHTFTTTRFFNIIPGPVNATVFDTTCH